MAEISDDELEIIKNEARYEGRSEREREWQELENTRRLTELENRLDSLTQAVVTAPPAEIAAAAQPESEPVAEAEAEAEQQEVEHVQAPPEPEHGHEKRKPKFHIL